MQKARPQAEPPLREGCQPLWHVVIKFDHQDRGARFCVQFEQVPRGLELELAARLVEQHPVDVLDGRRLQISDRYRCSHRFSHRRKKYEAQSLLPRQRHDFQFRRHDARQRAFTPGNNVVEVIRFAQTAVQSVAGPSFQQARWHALRNFSGVVLHQLLHQLPLWAQRVMIAADRFDAAIRQDKLYGSNVVRRRPID